MHSHVCTGCLAQGTFGSTVRPCNFVSFVNLQVLYVLYVLRFLVNSQKRHHTAVGEVEVEMEIELEEERH